MLTTTVDGLWVLQILAGIEVVAPEFGLRPVLPSVENSVAALNHPAAAELRAANVIDDAGAVDVVIREWLTVLARRDVAVVVQASRPRGPATAQLTLARYAQWWVAFERADHMVRLRAVGTAGTEAAARQVVVDELIALCGPGHPAPLKPVTLAVDRLAGHIVDEAGLSRWLHGQGIDADQQRMLRRAANPEQSAHASIVAVQCGMANGSAARASVGASVVTIIDAPEGRICIESVEQNGSSWLIAGPGTATGIGAAVTELLRRLPAGQNWHCYRKAV